MAGDGVGAGGEEDAVVRPLPSVRPAVRVDQHGVDAAGVEGRHVAGPQRSAFLGGELVAGDRHVVGAPGVRRILEPAQVVEDGLLHLVAAHRVAPTLSGAVRVPVPVAGSSGPSRSYGQPV
ncbi:hypothetical protein SDC9_126410 [bioreactor metagenome]|uniref:Uncharacterized protein n=1 Tax=bioreactor metagenome TaxID=1076179 RepID=A0A645CR42_9ZZZZ